MDTQILKELAQIANIVGIKNSGTYLGQTMDYLLACEKII